MGVDMVILHVYVQSSQEEIKIIKLTKPRKGILRGVLQDCFSSFKDQQQNRQGVNWQLLEGRT